MFFKILKILEDRPFGLSGELKIAVKEEIGSTNCQTILVHGLPNKCPNFFGNNNKKSIRIKALESVSYL